MNVRDRWWIAPPKHADALDARDKALTAVKNHLTSRGIVLPFPTHQILFHDQTEDGDGNPREARGVACREHVCAEAPKSGRCHPHVSRSAPESAESA